MRSKILAGLICFFSTHCFAAQCFAGKQELLDYCEACIQATLASKQINLHILEIRLKQAFELGFGVSQVYQPQLNVRLRILANFVLTCNSSDEVREVRNLIEKTTRGGRRIGLSIEPGKKPCLQLSTTDVAKAQKITCEDHEFIPGQDNLSELISSGMLPISEDTELN